MTLTLVFHGNLRELLAQGLAVDGVVRYHCERRASIKDIVESLGVPHPEIARLTADGREIGFEHIASNSEQVEIWPLTPPVDLFTPTRLRPQPLIALGFVVDVNVGRLAALLRMAGLDTVYRHDMIDEEIASIAAEQRRVLLTRDGNLLKRKKIEFGHLIRAAWPREQLLEVVRLFSLGQRLKPFTRCMRCNQPLVPVAKEAILHRLEPLTRKYYDSFYICTGCDRIYWPGSHRQKMEGYLAAIGGKP